MTKTIESKVIKILATVMKVDVSELNSDSSTDTLPTWDSMNHMKLVMFLEEEFDVHFSEDQIVAEMLSCKQIVDIITTELDD